jgi:hypothetical protein
MGRWTDIARWIGPSPNRTTGGMVADVRGVVVHIASGSFEGTIAWQRNPDAEVSSHFIVSRSGEIVQMVDTSDGSWAQKAGNRTWLSIENEGRTPGDPGYKPGQEKLTDAQITANARILVKAHQIYGAKVPLQLATAPAGRGLGHHSMGAESGADWGHSACPGTAIKAQKAAILARAAELAGGAPATTPPEDDMQLGDTFTIPNWDKDPRLPANESTSVQTALAVAQQRSYQAKLGTDLILAQMKANAAADEVRDKALQAAVDGITSNGGPDSAPIVAAVKKVGDDAQAQFTALHTRIVELEAELEQARHAQHDAAQAEADATADKA